MKQRAITRSGKITTLSEDTLHKLAAALHGSLLLPSSPGYHAARGVWNGMIDKQPALIARCASNEDVQKAVNFARRHDLLLSIRGGGHSIAGYAVCDGALMIDLSPMTSAHIDLDRLTVRVEGGACWRDVDTVTSPLGLAVPGGLVSTTGVGGLALGGGLGWLRRKYGLSCDSLISADLVTAAGEQITVSENDHPDLFWAMRGGGGNFGAVTAFTFRLHPVGPLVYLANVAFPLDKAVDVFIGWMNFFQDGANIDIASDAILACLPDLPEIPPALHNAPVLLIQAAYLGKMEEGVRRLRPLQTLAEPLFDASGPVTFLDLQCALDVLYPARIRRYYWKSLYLDEPDIQSMLDSFSSRPSRYNEIILWRLGGAISDQSPEVTAYPHRTASYLCSIDAAWEEVRDDEVNREWVRKCSKIMANGGKTYANFPDLYEPAGVTAHSAYGQNYERLKEVKRQYDPDNFFRSNVNILP